MRRWLIILMFLLLTLSGCSTSDLGLTPATEAPAATSDPAQSDPTEERSCVDVPGACVTEDVLSLWRSLA